MTIDDDVRPNPDHLLQDIKKEKIRKETGKLKIFLGMVAGVGKTYAMLRAGKGLRERGVDVVAGIIETHKRKETEAQLIGLEILPRKRVLYKDKTLEEFHLDLALSRKPQVILVDELAHSNIPSSRNNKRYLDIMELLHAGIDVYTTVNVQHIESISNTVKEITEVTIRETVPDSFFDIADEILVIDLPPEDLIKRLQDGLIYDTARASAAGKNFFKIGNLTALRELTLRATAERVDRDLREYRLSHNIQEIWKSSHRLLVAVFASPYAENLIRSTRRLADSLGATWIGAYIDDNRPRSDEEKILLAKNIALVQELGGEVITSKDEDPVRGLMRIARQNNVTQIVVGKSARRWWQNLLTGGSLVSRLTRASEEIDIYSIANVLKGKEKRTFSIHDSLRLDQTGNEFGYLVVTMLASWGLAAALSQFLGYLTIGFVFLIVVCLAGLYFSRLSVFILAALFAFIHNYFFIPPLYSLTVERTEDFMMLTMFFMSAAITGHLTSRLKARENSLAASEESTLASYHLAKELLKAKGIQEIVEIGAHYLERSFAYQVLVLTRVDGIDKYAGSWPQPYISQREKAVTDWVLANSQHAGKFTQTLSASQGHYIPLIGKDKIYGVICINSSELKSIKADQFSVLESFSNQIASALEREDFHNQAKKLDIVESSHKLYKTLLDSVSHELKTPLSAIKGCASALLDPLINQNQSATCDLANEVLVGSARLQRVVENLLDMSRIDSGLIKPKIVSYSLDDLLQSAIRKFHAEIPMRQVTYQKSNSDIGILCDPVLCEQGVLNILHNANMYSPEGQSVEVTTLEHKGFSQISIRDFGPGLKVGGEDLIFEKFYRADPQFTGGIGLGLSIVRNFIELQNGKITAQNHASGGAEFTLFLPLERQV